MSKKTLNELEQEIKNLQYDLDLRTEDLEKTTKNYYEMVDFLQGLVSNINVPEKFKQ